MRWVEERREERRAASRASVSDYERVRERREERDAQRARGTHDACVLALSPPSLLPHTSPHRRVRPLCAPAAATGDSFALTRQSSQMTAEAEGTFLSEFFSSDMRKKLNRLLDNPDSGGSSPHSGVSPRRPPLLHRWPSLVEEAHDAAHADLRRWDLDVHALEDAQLFRYIEIMLEEWVPTTCSISVVTIRTFILSVVQGYPDNPFHNKCARVHAVSLSLSRARPRSRSRCLAHARAFVLTPTLEYACSLNRSSDTTQCRCAR